MKLSNITFIEEINSDYKVLDLISGSDDIKKFLISFGSIEDDKIINIHNFSYTIEEFKIELMDGEFLNLELYVKKI
ncbi:hypothetical protein MW871_16165 [Flavobacterium sp. I-SCBP12n]|uniref:Uncharacterized protein n=1 Tax=Flavobacterium pygoscelis TaxID=2893176 RepID=A0A9X1Y162_9FLAO|nr:hypothetical protein [Flavobacterium pygoscelis]MCK8143398.1 hypothetical protein [Flavobacterium pygoscelis]MCK8143427.1 hypothetical protein [Flavobacterium pygoscelis]